MRAALVLLILLPACVDLSRPSGLAGLPSGPDARPDLDIGAPVDAANDPVSDEASAGPDTAVDGGDDPTDGPPEAPRLEKGAACDDAQRCASGFCTHGVCCDSACATSCFACNLAGSIGTCAPVPAGDDPWDSCAADPVATCGHDGTCDGAGQCRVYPSGTECAAGRCAASVEYAASTCDGKGTCGSGASRVCAGMCSGSSCASSCVQQSNCQVGFYCGGGHCVLRKPIAAACGASVECASNFCVDGVCCSSQCGAACFSCKVPGSVGACVAAPSGTDPRAQCPMQASSTCGHAGGCNGNGACLLYATGTVCGGSTCTAGSETPSPQCNGAGQCQPQATRNCGAFACAGTACATTCTSSSACAPGFTCSAGSCVRDAGLQLYWRFDETSGTTAIDSSGNGLSGKYVADSGGLPTTSSDTPRLLYPDGASRGFLRAGRQAVQLLGAPASLRPANNFTISLWYHAVDVDSVNGTRAGAELFSMANLFLLRLRPTQIEFAKSLGPGPTYQCHATAPTFLDGHWHHLAAVASSTAGISIYFDGAKTTCPSTTDVPYAGSSFDLFVARHAAGETQWDFEGNLDEIRFYTRPLSDAEIGDLAKGLN